VTKPDWLARSLPDARDIADDLTRREVGFQCWGSVHDPTDPVARLLFNVLAIVGEFEADLISMRTREGMKNREVEGPSSRQAGEAVRTSGRISSAEARPAECSGIRLTPCHLTSSTPAS
jgi:DNA invertase Pin-like site-specific DNA recombinase